MRSVTHEQLVRLLEKSKTGQTTQTLATGIQLSRSTTSLYLNELLENGEVIKSGSKPVLWQLKEAKMIDDVFDQYIGSDGSAKSEIDKCKAAVLYPPLGLPLLITGASGVGKSFLAKLIFRYLHQNHLSGAKKFFVFNCADYANNPELLSSILFGYTKGAFTGAEKEKAGLLAQANEGVLFLDEVHRLSNENQEKLFQFMDTGCFRPIGEEEKSYTSSVRLIFATTEKPEEVLLPTFYRRISVCVQLPAFHERPIFERLDLVNYLFLREAKRIKKNLTISKSILMKLMEEELAGNVGSLANKVQLYCADALRENSMAQTLNIGETKGSQSLFLEYTRIKETSQKKIHQKLHASFMQLIDTTSDFRQMKQEIIQFDKQHLEGMFQTKETMIYAHLQDKIQSSNRFMIDNEELTAEPVRIISRIIQLSQAQNEERRIEKVKQCLAKCYPRTLLLARYLTSQVRSELKLFAETFLGILLVERISEDIRYQALLVAHGNTTATSIQAVANKLCGEYIFDAINMPLTSSVRDVIAQVKLWLSERDTSEGVIMLVDMGSLTQLYKSLKPQILGELLVINNLTTSYALEIGQQLVSGKLFYDIAKSSERHFKTSVQYFEGFSVEKNVIIASISGQDIAKKIKAICEKYLNPEIKLIVLNFNELMNTLERAYEEEDYLKETTLILTTSYLNHKTDVPTLNLLDVLDEDIDRQVTNVLKQVAHQNNVPGLRNELIYFFSKEGLSEKLDFLNPDVIIRQVEDVAEKFEKRFGLQLNAKMKFNLMMHLALLVERTILGTTDYEVPEDIQKLKVKNKLFFQNAKNIFYTLEQFYHIQISDWELYVIYEILVG